MARFRRNMRLTDSRQFETVYKANVRARVGPLVVWAQCIGAGMGITTVIESI